MAIPDTLRHTRIPLTHGSGAIPAVGFGTLIPDPVATKQATRTALEVGFRHLDYAERYRNEEAIGDAMQEAFKAGRIQREDVFVTTKLWNNNHRPERVKPAFDASRRRLQLDYVDCYLIHTLFAFRPGDEQDPRDERGQVIYDSGVTLVETWRAPSASWTTVSASRSGCQTLLWTSYERSLRQRGSSLLWCRSNPIRTSRNGTCSNIAICMGSSSCVRGVGAWDGAQIAGRSGDRRHRTAPPQNPCPSRARLGDTARHSFLDYFSHAQPHPGEFRAFHHAGRPMREIRGITTSVRFNAVVETGVPGFIPRAKVN
jgi:hypothetical protein